MFPIVNLKYLTTHKPMKFIKPRFEIIPTSIPTLSKDIELVARNCYKSEGKITANSDEILIRKLINSGHNAMLEFGQQLVFRVKYSGVMADELMKLFLNVNDAVVGLNGTYRPKYLTFSVHDMWIYIGGNYRAFRDLITNAPYNILTMRIALAMQEFLPAHMVVDCEELCGITYVHDMMDYAPAILVPESELLELPISHQLLHMAATVRLITDRGVTHEVVRHRECSFAQESTRYVGYTTGNIQYIIPTWLTGYIKEDFDDNERLSYKIAIFVNTLKKTAVSYNKLRATFGWAPQQARNVLPNSVKTDIIIKANLLEWKHMFEQRTASGAHPQMRELMIPLQKQLVEMYPCLK